MTEEKNLGYCPLRRPYKNKEGVTKECTCTQYCAWFDKNLKCCIVFGINKNLYELTKKR